MPVYRYSPNSQIDEIEIIPNSRGEPRAYLHAGACTTAEQLAAIRQFLNTQGYKSVPMDRDGRPYLEVRAFGKSAAFLQQLGAQGMLEGAQPAVLMPYDTRSFRDKAGDTTLKMAGWAYNISDIAYMWYSLRGLHHAHKAFKAAPPGLAAEELKALKGTVNAEKMNVGAGVGYAMGGVVLTSFGGKDQSSKEIRVASEKVKRFLHKDGMRIDDDTGIAQATEERPMGPIERIKNTLGHYPSEALNLVYTGVGALLALSSIKKVGILRAQGHKASEDIVDIGLGAMTLSSAMAGLLIKEKKPVEGEPKRTGLAGVWDWIQEKPLRATGYGFMVSTGFHAWSTFWKYRKEPAGSEMRKTIGGRAVFVLGNIAAEILMVLSSKGHGEGVQTDKSVADTIIANAAQIIARQQPAGQSAAIEQLAGYMSSSEMMGGKSEAIAAKLREQVSSQQRNPWAAKLPTVAPANTNLPLAANVNEKPSTKVASRSYEAALAHEASHIARAKA